jgi:hypothetical protein
MKVVDPAALAGTRVHARYCEGVPCCEPDDEVRVYPILFNVRSARVILCRPCWEQEPPPASARQGIGCPEHWPTRDWDEAQRYPEDAPEEAVQANWAAA